VPRAFRLGRRREGRRGSGAAARQGSVGDARRDPRHDDQSLSFLLAGGTGNRRTESQRAQQRGRAPRCETPRQAAEALRPLGGQLCYWLFAAGLIGTGLLAIPTLAGSAAYAFAETFGWNYVLDKRFH